MREWDWSQTNLNKIEKEIKHRKRTKEYATEYLLFSLLSSPLSLSLSFFLLSF
jgi:hypothetical protein